MKKLPVFAMALMLIFSGAAFAVSQDAQDSQQPRQHSGHGHGQGAGQGHGQGMMSSPEAMLDHLSKELDLTADQQTKIKPIVDDTFKQMQQLRGDASMSDQDRHAKMKQVHENALNQVRPILNADQQKKLDDLMSRHTQHSKTSNSNASPESSSKPQ
jgi:protein CpxP